MNEQEDDRQQKRQARQRAGTVCGYVGFALGFLSQLSVASETPDQFHLGYAAFFVLAFMAGGYVVGWLVGPAVARMFSQS